MRVLPFFALGLSERQSALSRSLVDVNAGDLLGAAIIGNAQSQIVSALILNLSNDVGQSLDVVVGGIIDGAVVSQHAILQVVTQSDELVLGNLINRQIVVLVLGGSQLNSVVIVSLLGQLEVAVVGVLSIAVVTDAGAILEVNDLDLLLAVLPELVGVLLVVVITALPTESVLVTNTRVSLFTTVAALVPINTTLASPSSFRTA